MSEQVSAATEALKRIDAKARFLEREMNMPDEASFYKDAAKVLREEIAKHDEPLRQAADLCELAWGVIANAYGGNWDNASEDWRGAAERWRDEWHRLLDVLNTKGA